MFIAGHIAAHTGAGTTRPTMERTSRPGHTSMDTRISPSTDTHISLDGDMIAIAITSSPIWVWLQALVRVLIERDPQWAAHIVSGRPFH